ncbi:uncharacterized protein At2g02148 [Physcomitrium patens]|uniref:Uncharacterized protein n=1 Tax=Physcomitrium patens TaxID=3218 RepID=A9STN6_PHYPA|nr:uncharacterized protein At2g02148-like [Physcomitrium patens]PNR53270.1 hypothetical protein PHYPA_009646 [Physcomitrium patens]|eukprot:XP_024379170.1 uncharacterized protein At2g02148-like [Physcomitrella patens]
MGPDIHGMKDMDRDVAEGDELDNDDGSTSAGDYGNLALRRVGGQNPEHSMTVDSEESRSPYGVLTLNDVSPIESTRARFLQLIIDYFIKYHIISAAEAHEAHSYSSNGKDKLTKRKSRDVQYEGGHRYLLPLTFLANLYETLIREINQRLAAVEGLQERTFGAALEAAGGLYRRLVKKFLKSGIPYPRSIRSILYYFNSYRIIDVKYLRTLDKCEFSMDMNEKWMLGNLILENRMFI